MSPTLILSASGIMSAVKSMAFCLLVLIGLASVAHCGSGCAPIQAPNAKEQSYTAAIVGCAATAKTKAEDHACRVGVNKRYGLCEGQAATGEDCK